MNLEAIKKSIKILSINKGLVTIGTEKGYWSKGLEFGGRCPIILKMHKKYFKKPIGKFVSTESKNKELIIKADIDKDFLDRIK